jgi:hypothetical protein
MMQMLKSGGIEVVTDHLRTADADNPRGYFEFEAVKDIQQDASWLPEARGKAVKMISMLLFHLPPTEHYRVLFMDRDLDEVLQSQEAMLQRLNREAAPRNAMRDAFRVHLDHLESWLNERPDIKVLRVGYKDLVEQAEIQAMRITEFLGIPLNVAEMVNSVDPALYRNRNQPGIK